MFKISKSPEGLIEDLRYTRAKVSCLLSETLRQGQYKKDIYMLLLQIITSCLFSHWGGVLGVFFIPCALGI